MNNSSSTYRIADMTESECPRERLARLGPGSLSTPELLAILLRVGVPGESAIDVASRLLKTFGDVTGLHRAPFDELCNQHGIGQAKASQIKAALELGNRLKRSELIENNTIHNPEDAANYVQFEMSALEQEELRVMLLDTRNRMIDTVTVYRGSLNSSQVRVGELFKAAIRRNAASIIVIHNHPRGDPTPSPDDIAVTRAIVQAGKLLDVTVLDHLIIGREKHISLKERGVEFNN
jgi:DNA repair protein RadC